MPGGAAAIANLLERQDAVAAAIAYASALPAGRAAFDRLLALARTGFAQGAIA